MSDPAVEAAQRATNGTHGVAVVLTPHAGALAIEAAREMAAPIRELIEKWESPTVPGAIHNGAPESQTNVAQDFIDDLRELVYPSEEP